MVICILHVVCGMCCVVYCMWSVVYDIFVACSVWHVVCSVFCAVYFMWCVVCGIL